MKKIKDEKKIMFLIWQPSVYCFAIVLVFLILTLATDQGSEAYSDTLKFYARLLVPMVMVCAAIHHVSREFIKKQ